MTPQRLQRLHAALNQRQPDLTVVTDYVHKGRNLSAIVRTADAVGILEVHSIIGDKEYRAFRGTAKGSHRWIAVKPHRNLSQALDPLRKQGFQIVAAQVGEQSRDFREVDYTQPTALLLGSEKEGLSTDGREAADIHVTIPMMGMVESFNVSVAAAIILSEAQHQRQQAGFYDSARLDPLIWHKLFFEWAHPKLAEFCQRHHLEYPALDEEGDLIRPSQWYGEVREQLNEQPLSPEA